MAIDRNKLWRGGLEAGLGLGTLSVILSALKSADRLERVDSGQDDLVLHLGKKKKDPVRDAMKVASMDKEAFFAKLLVGAGITGASAYAVKMLADRVQEKRLKREIDDLNDSHTEGLVSLKSAGENKANPVTRAAMEVALLSLLAGGAASYATLSNAFPKKEIQLNDKKKPRRVVIEGFGSLAPDGKADGPFANPNQKAASADFTFEVGEEDHLKAASLLYATLADLRKEAGERSALADVACLGGMGDAVADLGVDAILDSPDQMPKWAALTPREKLVAASGALSDPALGKCAHTLLQAELYHHNPEIAEAAANLHGHAELAPLLVKLASCMSEVDYGSGV